jgi:rubrerythrin
MSPEQVTQAMMPIVAEANRIFDDGATMQSVLREAVLAGFLMGRGAAPEQAMQTVLQWRMSGLVPSLVRQMRSDVPRTLPAPAGALPAPATGGAAPLTPRDRELLGTQVQKFIQDQANAAAFYRELMEQVPGQELKAYVEHALEDEQKHYQMLTQLYRELTGRTYEAQAQPTEFADLRTGLKMAMDDEYEASEEYRDVYLRYQNQQIRDLFFELMNDELEHATRFNYVLQSLPDGASGTSQS